MRKLLVALAVLGLVVTQAQAFDVKATSFSIHLKDATSLWTQDYDGNGIVSPAESTNAFIPRASESNYVAGAPKAGYAPDGIAFGDESRSVFMLDQVTYPVPPNQDVPKGTVCGMVYGLTLVRADIVGPISNPLFSTLYFTGGKMEFWADPTADDVSNGAGIDFADTFDPLNDGNAPLAWDNSDPNNPKFPNVNKAPPVGEDATLWLKTEFVPFLRVNTGLNGTDPTEADITVMVNLNHINGTGTSLTSYMSIIGGSYQGLLVENAFPVPLTKLSDGSVVSTTPSDLSVAYTSTFFGNTPGTDPTYLVGYAKAGGWQQESSDPIKGAGLFIPEPTSLSLLGLGIAGLLGYRRRQK